MGIARSSILRGPASITFGSQVIYTEGDIKCQLAVQTFPLNTAAYGKVDDRLDDVTIKLSFTPAGKWTTALLAVLYPYTNPTSGTSIFTSSDVPLTLHPLNGSEKIVFTAAAITKMPGLVLSAGRQPFKDMEIECILKSGGDRSAADALWTLTASAVYSDTSFTVTEIPTVIYSASLAAASSPWDAILTEAGFECDFDLKTAPVKVDTLGTVDRSIVGLDISAKLKPIGMTVAQVLDRLKLQNAGVARGMQMSAGAANLVITGGTGNPIVTLNNARLVNAGQIYGAEALRHDTIEFRVTRPSGTGAMFSCAVA